MGRTTHLRSATVVVIATTIRLKAIAATVLLWLPFVATAQPTKGTEFTGGEGIEILTPTEVNSIMCEYTFTHNVCDEDEGDDDEANPHTSSN